MFKQIVELPGGVFAIRKWAFGWEYWDGYQNWEMSSDYISMCFESIEEAHETWIAHKEILKQRKIKEKIKVRGYI